MVHIGPPVSQIRAKKDIVTSTLKAAAFKMNSLMPINPHNFQELIFPNFLVM